MLGGSSSHNVMMANRGSRYVYDRWAELGNKGWSWDDVLPYFKKLERVESPELLKSGTDLKTKKVF